ncbi:MAG: hypothetical protein FWB75_04760 [Oscillospiraceae bacterium]|nr:hypothetical protein [Oscillospiraceae bacterium]MCL2201256.1 hypothetical protein [Oscillospiraceae bacterium]
MVATFKMLFDLAFYYAVSSVYLNIFTQEPPAAQGISLLLIVFAAYVLLRKKPAVLKLLRGGGGVESSRRPRPLMAVLFVMPVLFLLTGASLPQIVQFIPAWGYLVYCLWTENIGTNKAEFNVSFRKISQAYLLALPGMLFFPRLAGTLMNASPYFMVWLVIGICLKRILRSEGSIRRGKGIVVLAAVGAIGAVLSFVLTEQVLLSVLSWFFSNIIQYVIYALVFSFGWLFNGLAWLFGLLIELLRSETIQEAGQGFDAGYTYTHSYDGTWFEIAIWIVVAIGTAVALWFFVNLIRAMRAGRGRQGEVTQELSYSEQSEALAQRGLEDRRKLLRPRNPAHAVRWYYRRYLLKGTSKGAQLERSDTSQSVLGKFSDMFNGSEERAFRELYLKARYQSAQELTKADAEEAARLWKQMRR